MVGHGKWETCLYRPDYFLFLLSHLRFATNDLNGLVFRVEDGASLAKCVQNLWYNAWVSVVCPVVEGGSWRRDVENIASVNGVA
jgi:hypothetical protein